MLKQVSWAEYAIALAVLLAAYYAVILILYFRDDVRELLSGKRKLRPVGAGNVVLPMPDEKSAYSDDRGMPELEEERLYDVVDHLVPELKPLFDKGYIKPELVMAIQQKLKEYGHLKGTAFQVVINNFISIEAEKQCSIQFSEDELRVLWL